MKKLLIATTNKGKLHEIALFLKDLPITLVSLSDVGITNEPEETGKNYTENSQLKAVFYSKKSGLPALADDGGIEIMALDGAPGLKSHRWLGPDTTEEDIVVHMKKIAKTLPPDNRKAYFRTVLSLAMPDGRVKSFSGSVEGIIPEKPSLNYEPGYPYRSFFYLPKLKKYYFETELTPSELTVYNHRYKPIQRLKKLLLTESF